jgi:hypothetical protein
MFGRIGFTFAHLFFFFFFASVYFFQICEVGGLVIHALQASLAKMDRRGK